DEPQPEGGGMIVKTEAIVFRTIEFSESSIIATLFTRSNGVVAVIAKGARKPKSKFAAYLVPGQALEVVFQYKPTRNVQTLTDVSYLMKLDQLRFDIEKMALVVTTMELASQVLHENEVNENLFNLLIHLLKWVDQSSDVSRIIFPYIQLRIIDQIGIGLQIDETIETNSSSKGYINIETGTLSGLQEGDQSVILTEQQLEFILSALLEKKASIFEKKLKSDELSGLIEYLDRYIRYHVEGVKPRRSDDIFEKILNH
ncbi:MAG: DNA repair protein RecO, partial [Balneolaceae bacterium]